MIIKNLEKSPEGEEILVPITSSLYVPGKLADKNKVLIDLGTGYFAEKSTKESEKFCDRKLKML